MEIDGVTYLRADQFRGFVNNFTEAIRHGDSSMLFEKRGLRLANIVDMEEFVCSKEYLGLRRSVRPAVLSRLIECFDSDQYYFEILCTGGTGIGKGYFANCGLARCLYYLGCLHNPQMEYGLSPGSSIYFVIQSKTATLAKKAVFDEFKGFIKDSPWFQKYFPYDKAVNSELRFPHNVYVTPFGGGDDQALGLNVLGGILDELNFMLRTKDSVAIQYTGEAEFDQAERVYNTINRRMLGRFQAYGRVPGKLFLLSSSNYPGDFTDRKEKEAQRVDHIYVMKMTQWESIPSDRFSGETFTVMVGTDQHRSRILEEHEDAPPEARTIDVPVEYRNLYEKDVDGALKDTAGITTAADSQFISYKEELTKAMADFEALTGGRSLFYAEEVSLRSLYRGTTEPDFAEIVDMDYVDDIKGGYGTFALHHDVGSSGDASGLAISRIVGYKLLPLTRYFSPKVGEWVEVQDMREPIYQVEGALRIKERRGEEIEVAHIVALVMFLHQHLGIKYGSADWYQSIAFLQHLRSVGIKAGTISVDANLAPYAEFKKSIKEGRLLARGEILKTELLGLILTDDGRKVDHPAGGTKDVADSVCGTIHLLRVKEASYKHAQSIPRRRNRATQQGRVTQRLDRAENPRRGKYSNRRLRKGRVIKIG